MITDTMSYAEIAKEMEEDFMNAQRYTKHLSLKKYMKEAMSRPNSKLIFKPIEWTSPRRNKMIFIFSSRGKRALKHEGLLINTCCIFLYKGELCLAAMGMTSELRLQIQLFTSHFFQRYNERFLKDPSLGALDVIRRFMHDEITDLSSQQVEHPKLGVEYISALSHGCSFTEIAEDNTYAIHHTYMVDGMLRTDQLIYLAALRFEKRMEHLDASSPSYADEAMRTDRVFAMADEFKLTKEKFHKNPNDPDMKEVFTDLCLCLSKDILFLVELHPEWEALHRLTKRLLCIATELEGDERTAALLKL